MSDVKDRSDRSEAGWLRRWAPVLFLCLPAVAGCTGGRPAKPPRARAAVVVDPVQAWLAQIPAACREELPVVGVACPEPQADPPGACIVEQRDLADDTMKDRFLFVGDRLVRHDATVSELQNESTTYTYDERGRSVSQTTCTRAIRGEPKTHPSWREPMVYYEHDTMVTTRTERKYAPGSDVPVLGQVVSTTIFDGKALSYDMKLCYRFDGQGRRTHRYQIYRMSDRPLAFDTMVRTYTYSGQRLTELTSSTLNIDRRPDGAAPGIRFQNSYTAVFSYDGQGRLAGIDSAGSKSRYTWDAAGRLVGWGSATMTWDAQNRLVSLRLGDAKYDREYLYDAAGRFTGARFANGGGYRMVYGAACAAGFSSAAFLPNVDNFQYYEGKDTL